MGGYLTWAEKELKLAGYDRDDSEEGPNKWVAENVLELLKGFSDQGHSGSSAPFVANIFERLAKWKPLTPLTGNDDEWEKVGPDLYQNTRDSAVFKSTETGAYFIEGIVFWEWVSYPDMYDGKPYKAYFTSRESCVEVTFPWTRPDSPEYRFRPTEAFPNEELS
jgi:hypothetical protein